MPVDTNLSAAYKKMNRLIARADTLYGSVSLHAPYVSNTSQAILADYFISTAPEDLELFNTHVRKSGHGIRLRKPNIKL